MYVGCVKKVIHTQLFIVCTLYKFYNVEMRDSDLVIWKWHGSYLIFYQIVTFPVLIINSELIGVCGVADKSGDVKRCGVTKTISPPSIKLEPPEPEPQPQPMLPDSSSDLRRGHGKQAAAFHGHRVKTEFEVKQEPCWDTGEVWYMFPPDKRCLKMLRMESNILRRCFAFLLKCFLIFCCKDLQFYYFLEWRWRFCGQVCQFLVHSHIHFLPGVVIFLSIPNIVKNHFYMSGCCRLAQSLVQLLILYKI